MAQARQPLYGPLFIAGALLVLAGLLAAPAQAQTTVPHDWALNPAGLGPGDSFRLLFISSTKRNATSPDIADYNTFVQDRAAAGHPAIQAYSSGFRVVGCTEDVDARDNTATTGTGVPIYWLNGPKIADDYADFYDGSWDNESDDDDRDENGTNSVNTTPMANNAFTGCEDDGTLAGATTVIRALGLGPARIGRLNSSTPARNPISGFNNDTLTNTRPFYGLSAVFTIAAPPPPEAEAEAARAVVIPP